jgi:formylglycine-generating enzyme required for sulfatase activity
MIYLRALSSLPFGGMVLMLGALMLMPGTPGHAQSQALPAGTVFRDCADCPEMVVIPPGDFTMGRTNNLAREAPPTPVVIRKPFAISRFEVTIAQYEACVTAGGCYARSRTDNARDARRPNRENLPITMVSMLDFRLYLAWLSGKTGQYYRFPSEAEWEWAASGGLDAPNWWGGGNVLPETANCNDCPGEYWMNYAPVGQFPPNPFGLHDMLGNVSEYVADCWFDTHAGHPGTETARQPCDGYLRTLRGASWFTQPKYVSRQYRRRYPFSSSSNLFGLRLVRELAVE